MRASLKIPAWAFLIMTGVTASYVGWLATALKSGKIEGQSAGLTFMFVVTWLGIMGLATLLFGILGIWRSRKHSEHVPVVYKLCIGMGAVALIGGATFGVYG